MSNLIIGDEAIFQLKGSVSTQNVRCYAPKGEPPEDFEKSNSREKLHIWIGLCGNGQIIGPHFFNENVLPTENCLLLSCVCFHTGFRVVPDRVSHHHLGRIIWTSWSKAGCNSSHRYNNPNKHSTPSPAFSSWSYSGNSQTVLIVDWHPQRGRPGSRRQGSGSGAWRHQDRRTTA